MSDPAVPPSTRLRQGADGARLPQAERALKAAFDLAAAAVLLVLLAPLLLILAALVGCEGGAVLFRHTRVGRDGVRFDCLKFRTMRTDADRALAHLLLNDLEAAAEWAAHHKLRRDPRVTRIGRVLRSTSLDELPQLFNVLRGEMSLVGPRPIVPAEVARYGRAIDAYTMVRPGLTGLWQVSGRSNTTFELRTELDRDYVENWSFLRDLEILARTVPAILMKRGAH